MSFEFEGIRLNVADRKPAKEQKTKPKRPGNTEAIFGPVYLVRKFRGRLA